MAGTTNHDYAAEEPTVCSVLPLLKIEMFYSPYTI